MSFILAVSMIVMARASVSAPVSAPANSQFLRPIPLTRKNSLFAGSDGGGRTWATIATLLATAKLNGIDPAAWLTVTLERIAAGWPNRDLDAPLPWNHEQG